MAGGSHPKEPALCSAAAPALCPARFYPAHQAPKRAAGDRAAENN